MLNGKPNLFVRFHPTIPKRSKGMIIPSKTRGTKIKNNFVYFRINKRM